MISSLHPDGALTQRTKVARDQLANMSNSMVESGGCISCSVSLDAKVPVVVLANQIST